MSDNKKIQNFGRQAPAQTGQDSIRSWLKTGALMGVSLALALQPTQRASAQEVSPTNPLNSQIAAERIEAEIAAVELAFGGELNIVNMQQERYTDAVGGMFDPDGPEADEYEPVELFYHPDIQKIEQDLFEAFEQAGTFRTGPGEQFQPAEGYFPDGAIPNQVDEMNAQLASHFSRIYASSLINPNPANGSAMVLDFESGEERRRVCVTVLTPSITDEDTFMSGFTSMDTRGIDLELADLYQYVANHELAHCMNTNSGMPQWFNETMSDAYALTRHMQLNGDDGLAETVLHMRHLSGVMRQGHDHYTVPGLERVIPKIREAYENGELDGLDPKQIRDFTVKIMLGENEQEMQANGNSLVAAQHEARTNVSALPHHTVAQEGRLVFKEETPEHLREKLQETLDHTNASIAYLSRPNAMLQSAGLNSSEAEMDYRANLDEYVATQESAEVARDGMRLRLYGIAQMREAFIQENGIENVGQFDNAFDATKITISRQVEIMEEYERNLSQERAIVQDQTAELGRDVG